MATVRCVYGVPAYRGREVFFRGMAHSIISATGSHLWLRCTRTGQRVGPSHPTWEIDYLDGRGNRTAEPTPMDYAWGGR